ncbi:MAG: toll/interleukin-1 receptor domain-containing protein [Spirochaetales bacterium]|nr:toll/interleukin-1 receptor domain-containing protein [Spirochaetales bacterium]
MEAYRGAKPYIFASYSHQNMREVFSVIKKLSACRFRIWYDEGVEPGNEWPEDVGRALLGCSQFIVFMSRSAADSRNVRNEINLATGDNKNVLVVFLEPTELSEGMRLQIGTVQFLNRFEMTEREFLDKLKKVLSGDLKS